MNSFNLAKIFSDNMVLQRNKEIKLWGESDDGNSITVSINNTEVTVEAQNAKWTAVLPPMEANENCEVRVHSNNSADSEIVIKNVAIGEVWIAGGQSNMEFFLREDAEGKELIPSVKNANIRFYDCPKTSYEGQENDDDLSEYGFWRPCDSENAPYYSAVGFYFAQKIYDSQKVPVGIVGCKWSETTASTWLDESFLAEDEELKVYLNEYEEAVKDIDLEEYERKIEEEKQRMKQQMDDPGAKAFVEAMRAGSIPAEQLREIIIKMASSLKPLIGPKFFNRPAGLYHNMLEKISGYSARGVIWYQGESDDIKANIYGKLFSAVIKCWREVWKEELPFLFVQLAPFGSFGVSPGKNFSIVRDQQEIVSKTVSKAYMASIMDVGAEFDIHPQKKRKVGERLALLARNKVYGENIISEAPEVDFISRNLGNVSITFKNVGDKFVLKGEKINGIQIFVDSEEISEFKSEVNNKSITIESEQFNGNSKIEIRFACGDYVEVNLYSSVDLPVKPFKVIV